MSMKKLGKSVLTLNGQRFQTYPGASFDPGGTVRSEKVGHVVHGYSEAERAGSLEVEIDHGTETDIIAINKMADVTMMLETDTGQTYVGRNWWVSEPATFTDGPDSKVKFKVMGPPVEPMTVRAS